MSLQKDDRVCAQLFCFDAGSGYCVAYRPAAEGSPCGDGQVRDFYHANLIKKIHLCSNLYFFFYKISLFKF